jgi:multidrug efflux pump subunit AcrB
VTAVSQTILRQLSAGTQPPLVINYSASTVPILQLALSGLSESELDDVGLNFLRTQLVTVPGASVPYPYGGRQCQVMVDLDQRLLQSKGLSPGDVVTALGQQNLVLPSSTAKIGVFEYDVAMNASPRTVAELNDLPVKVVGNSTIYLKDVAHVRDGFAPQTNVVRQDGQRGTLVTILKTGTASTLDVVSGIRKILPSVIPTLPPALKIQPLADQSIFVRVAVSGVIREAVIAACLTAVMILIFLGSWRSTVIIAVSIPLSILTSVIALSLLGETINIMTLGGLALAVGILVDDATVTIAEFPGATFYFLPADIVTQIINFGLPAPIDIQIDGADVQGNRRVAEQMLNELRQVPGLTDLRIQQRFDYPRFDVIVDRTKAGQGASPCRTSPTASWCP